LGIHLINYNRGAIDTKNPLSQAQEQVARADAIAYNTRQIIMTESSPLTDYDTGREKLKLASMHPNLRPADLIIGDTTGWVFIKVHQRPGDAPTGEWVMATLKRVDSRTGTVRATLAIGDNGDSVFLPDAVHIPAPEDALTVDLPYTSRRLATDADLGYFWDSDPEQIKEWMEASPAEVEPGYSVDAMLASTVNRLFNSSASPAPADPPQS
jgi:hypothetical protein